MNQSSQKYQAGFSLAELIIGVGILGILMAVSASQLASFIPSMQLRAAVRELYSNMQSTRLNAVKTNTNWAMVFDPANNRYLVCSDKGPDDSWSSTADNTCPIAVDLTASYKNGVQYGHGNLIGNNSASSPPGAFPADNVSFNNNVLSFSPLGISNSGYVYLQNQKQTPLYAIGTLSSGAINIVKWAGGSWKR